MTTLLNSDTFVRLCDEIDRVEKALQDRINLMKEGKMITNTEASTERDLTEKQHNRRVPKQRVPIAIVGMAAIFPDARNIRQYWENIVGAVDCIKEVPPSRWSIEDYYDSDPFAEDKTYCKRGGFIPKIEFDPVEFGLPPNMLEVTDVSQLLGLVIAKEALQDAGYWKEREFNRETTGVILGAVSRQLITPLTTRLQHPIWEKVLKSSGIPDRQAEQIVQKIKSAYVGWDTNAFPGMLSNVIAGRIANRLDFGGTNCTIDAACASSLAALKMAISELQEYRSDMMLAGGVDPDNSIFTYVCFSKTPALSLKQQSKPFDSDSDGMLLGEGLGMVVLKRLEDAKRDGDKIYAVITGIGTSSDGRYKSIYAPRTEGQVKALQRAYEDAGIAPAEVGLIEAHGTGTIAGDRAEFDALREVFSQDNPNVQHIALGSVKSQIGHTKTAAGVASLIKTALALHHQILPPTRNVTNPNPRLKLETSPFYLNTKTRPWIVPEKTIRRAGISSMGFGGTNFHVVLEEAPERQGQTAPLHRPPQPIILFAETGDRLLAKCQSILEQLSAENGEREFIKLANSCKKPEIPAEAPRVGFVAKSLSEACEKLRTAIDLLRAHPDQAWEHPKGIYYRTSGMNLRGKVVALFSGQGSQYLEMGRELAINFPEFCQACAQLDELMCRDGLSSLSSVLFPPPTFDSERQEAQSKKLQRTEYTQPAIGLLSSTLYKLLQQVGFSADFAAGHSFGELTALWAAGVIEEKDYFSLVKARGQAMSVPDDPSFESGAMLAVKGSVSQIEAILTSFPEVAIANHNSPQQVVLAGTRAAVEKAQQALSESGFSPILLPLAAAFHTPLVARAQQPFAQAFQNICFHSPQIPVYTNVTGEPYPENPEAIQKILKEHLLNQVLFRQEIENIYAAGGYCFVEFGPRNILTNLVKEILGDRPHLALALNASRQKDSDLQLREAVVQLQVAGMPLQSLSFPDAEPEILETKPQKGKNVSVCLDGANFLSEKTKQKITNALQVQPQSQASNSVSASVYNGLHQKPTAPVSPTHSNGSKLPQKPSDPVSTTSSGNGIYRGKPAPSAPSTNGIYKEPATAETAIAYPATPAIPAAPVSSTLKFKTSIPAMLTNYQRILESLEYTLSQLGKHQSETLNVHQQYLSNQTEYARTFFQLMQQQIAIFGSSHNNADRSEPTRRTLLENSSHSLIKFHEQQAETLDVHEQYLNHQYDYVKNLLHLTQKSYSLLLAGDSANDFRSNSNNFYSASGSESFASDPTQQPKPSLPFKDVRQNTLEAPRQTTLTFRDSEVVPSSIEDRHNTGEVQNSIGESHREPDTAPSIKQKTASQTVTESKPSFSPAIAESESTAASLPTSIDLNDIDLEELSQTLLEIVSDKTGYPVEMLDLDMDLEADLGIDSIKRVEILGAMQDSYAGLPQPNLEELAEIEMRTLNQIVNYLSKLISEKKTV